MRLPLSEAEIIAPNFKKRLSGVTLSIIQLIPKQREMGVKIATLSPKEGLPDHLPALSWVSLLGLWRKPPAKPFRLWHARRNIEMVAGIIMRDVLRMKLKLIFTSASQRHHRRFTRFLIARMDRVIATSKQSGSFLQVPHQVIMHGIDVTRFRPPREKQDDFASSGLGGRYAIGCFGRLRHQKGTDLFVDAMLALLPDYPQWTAVIGGRATSKHQDFVKVLQQKIAAADLSERIVFLGEIQDIRQWYRRLTLYVAPSRHEGFGLTPLEAMASQTAVVASDAGVYPDLVPASCGRIVPAGDGAALTQAIHPYFANPQQTQAAGLQALAHVRKHFPLEKEATEISCLYQFLFSGDKNISERT